MGQALGEASPLHRGWTGLETVKGRLGLASRHFPEGRLAPHSLQTGGLHPSFRETAHLWPPHFWVALGKSLPLSGPHSAVRKMRGMD